MIGNLAGDEIYIAGFDTPSDPDEYIRIRVVESFRNLLKSAVPYWEYLYHYMKDSQ